MAETRYQIDDRLGEYLDEIVSKDEPVHLEMMDDDSASLIVGNDYYWIYVKRRFLRKPLLMIRHQGRDI